MVITVLVIIVRLLLLLFENNFLIVNINSVIFYFARDYLRARTLKIVLYNYNKLFITHALSKKQYRCFNK